jgi:PAS domain S-box-containing protein
LENPSDPPSEPKDAAGEDFLRLIIESATDFAIFATDPSGHVTSWNIGAERLLGYSDREILSQQCNILFTPEDQAAGAPEWERSTAQAEGRAEDERWHQRKDGSRFWGSGLLMPLRNGGGFVKILRDRTDRHRLGEELRESEARFRILATHIPQLVFRTRGSGERTWGSPQWENFTGLPDAASRGLGWLDAVHPDDREATLAAWPEAQRAGEYHVEHRIRRQSDGDYRWHQTRARPLQPDGPETEWVGTSTDIHELRGLKDRQQMLLAELQHRTRNLLAVVQAIARKTLQSNPSLETFSYEFESRLRALSRVQSLLARPEGEAIDLHEIVRSELAAHGHGEGGRIEVRGSRVGLPPSSAQALGLALHELATNALKYGALNQPEGRLTVVWRVDRDADERRVVLEWREDGVKVPDGATPRRKGYGSELIEQALPYQLKAKTQLEFGADGVRCVIAVPIADEGGVGNV